MCNFPEKNNINDVIFTELTGNKKANELNMILVRNQWFMKNVNGSLSKPHFDKAQCDIVFKRIKILIAQHVI